MNVEVETPSGDTYRWEANARSADLEPTGISFNTVLGEGFADGSVTLPRRTDIDWPDLVLLATVRFVDDEGFIAYEGRLKRTPRNIGTDGHAIQVQTQGWMSHAADRTFRRIYVDRDLSRWAAASDARREALYTGGYLRLNEPETVEGVEPRLNLPLRALNVDGGEEVAEAWYDAGFAGLGDVYYAIDLRADATGPNVICAVSLAADEVPSSGVFSGDLFGSSPAEGYLSEIEEADEAHRYAFVTLSNAAATADAKDRIAACGPLAVYGKHDLVPVGPDPGGFYASDIIRDLGEFCPMLDMSGVEQTNYPIEQAAFARPVTPHEAFRTVNNFHLWELSCWEYRRLIYRQSDITDFEWQLRPGEFGQGSNLEGYDADQLRNGLAVSFTDFAGVERTITPEDFPELRNADETNPANQLGIEKWGDQPFQVPFRCSAANAVQIGATQLAEMSRPRAAGQLSAVGEVRDAAGARQPAYRVRANESLILANHPSDFPRLVASTTYSHDTKGLTINVERPAEKASAQYARVQDRFLRLGL